VLSNAVAKDLTSHAPAALGGRTAVPSGSERHRTPDGSNLGDWPAIEELMVGPAGERTVLSWHRPCMIDDRPLLVSTALDITDRKQIESELARRANFDELTGLPNRTRIQQHVEATILRRGRTGHLALAFLDLDDFKHINDYYGHAIGDALLVKLAERITAH